MCVTTQKTEKIAIRRLCHCQYRLEECERMGKELMKDPLSVTWER